MKLNIKNFAKIKNADILIDGITVIAGENNTGKSTVGKILFSLYNSISGIEKKIDMQRKKEIRDMCQLMLRNYIAHEGTPRNRVLGSTMFPVRKISDTIARIKEEKETIELVEIEEIITDIITRVVVDKDEIDKMLDIIREMSKNVENILELPEDIIVLEILSRYFENVFYGQINSLIDKDSDAELKLRMKDKEINLLFENDRCIKFVPEINLLHNAIYIDNPFIIDKLSSYEDLNITAQLLKELLTSSLNENLMDGIIGTVLAKEKLSKIYETLGSVVDGKVQEQNDRFYFNKEGFNKPISVENLSTGLKSFVVLKMLIEKGKIREKDVLILDEPEVHLHPQWQIVYAELIVLLQKYFDLSIIVTTHSPYFLDAINLYSVKYGLKEKVNYYLSSEKERGVEIEKVDVDQIYKKMSSPIQILETLRYELNNQ
ncbi:MAG: AAA family ATPase [Firmicutes bacterium]|uniref:AAA family ATPase n=1 Tax=Candidatus Scybalomonas excrementavium TaxID=2840943 RepID=A0A9D9N8E2_9FIRM|nr:AAA family ATPase [Candidatus Scybalomonas excrementavium]